MFMGTANAPGTSIGVTVAAKARLSGYVNELTSGRVADLYDAMSSGIPKWKL
jgi:hypothetical protein